MPCVVVEELVVRYGDSVAVDGVSFTAEAGEVTVVLGPNGAGKTSTIEHLEGYRRADGGTSSVLGLDPVRQHAELSRLVGVMLQHGGIPTGIRPPEVLAQYAGFFDHPLDPDELLRTVGLHDRRRTTYRRLSGGEQQRLSLALALIGRPRCVFLDEPTAGVDLAGRDLIRSVIAGLRDDGVCVVVTTHDLDEAERLADHVVIIDHGTVVGAGAPSELISATGSDHVLFGAAPGLDVAALSAAVGAAVDEVSRGEYRVAAAPSPATVAAITSWLADHDLQLADLRAERQRLDDVFRRLTGGEDAT
ncbi:MAG: ABC transporter ATP-binding protein [Actinomycetota bacterium]|nr:ABC transporter ATP-binding protein [Actinomycetota bacterium]